MRGESELCCPAWAPPWALSPVQSGCLCKFWASLGAGQKGSPLILQGLQDPAKEMWPLTSFTHTHVQHFASASMWSRVSVTKNCLCSDLRVSKGQLNKRSLGKIFIFPKDQEAQTVLESWQNPQPEWIVDVKERTRGLEGNTKGRWDELPAGCVPIAPGTGQETPPFVKKDTYPSETRCPDRRMCNRRDRDGRNGHRNYIMMGGGEVWDAPRMDQQPLTEKSSWSIPVLMEANKAVTPLHMATKICAWRLTSFPSLWRGRGNASPVTFPRP